MIGSDEAEPPEARSGASSSDEGDLSSQHLYLVTMFRSYQKILAHVRGAGVLKQARTDGGGNEAQHQPSLDRLATPSPKAEGRMHRKSIPRRDSASPASSQ